MRFCRFMAFGWLLAVLIACSVDQQEKSAADGQELPPAEVPIETAPTTDPPLRFRIERLDPRADDLFVGEEFDSLGGGMTWSEGPLWLDDLQTVICSDVPQNRIMAWNETNGYHEWLSPSGGDSLTEGSNGLILDSEGRLVLCQHGHRQVARMDADLDAPQAKWTVLATAYEGKRFNSPNDLVYDSTGQLYFSDPPYGLSQQDEDPAKELDINGVYRLGTDGQTELLLSDLSRPNGVGLSVDGRMLYVANSDKEHAIISAYPLLADGSLDEPRWTLDLSSYTDTDPGLPDGLEVASDGRIYATGPGGVWVIHPDGSPLLRLYTGTAVSNVELDSDEQHLYMTSHYYLVRAKL